MLIKERGLNLKASDCDFEDAVEVNLSNLFPRLVKGSKDPRVDLLLASGKKLEQLIDGVGITRYVTFLQDSRKRLFFCNFCGQLTNKKLLQKFEEYFV